MSIKITEQNLIQQLRALLPELEDSYQQKLKLNEGEISNNYEFVAVIYKPILKRELSQGVLSDFLKRSALMMENVCESGDVEALNVIWVKIFEWLIREPEKLKLLWPILGNHTKAAIKDAAKRWKFSYNLP
jgi:hypothetical protein